MAGPVRRVRPGRSDDRRQPASRSTFRLCRGLAAKLADLFQREAAYCGFFTFELTIASGEALLVAITVTEAKTSVLDALAAGAGPV